MVFVTGLVDRQIMEAECGLVFNPKINNSPFRDSVYTYFFPKDDN